MLMKVAIIKLASTPTIQTSHQFIFVNTIVEDGWTTPTLCIPRRIIPTLPNNANEITKLIDQIKSG
jgi:hypothetical protein